LVQIGKGIEIGSIEVKLQFMGRKSSAKCITGPKFKVFLTLYPGSESIYFLLSYR
jgi:hypothetical protein